jgi:hypothetical protein
MNFYTIGKLKRDIDSNLHAGATSGLQDFFNTVDKGRLQFITKVRPEELIRKSYIEQALYPNVNRYAAPDGMKYRDIIEIKKLSGYRTSDSMDHPLTLIYKRRSGQKRLNSQNTVSVNYENGIKYLEIYRPYDLYDLEEQYVVIHDCESLSTNGTWNTGGNVVNFKLDELNRIVGTGCFSFDINNSSTTGYLENTTLTAFDLNDFLQKGASFAWLDLPIPKEMISVKLTMGSTYGVDYYYSTVNQPHDNNVFTTGWNLLKYMLNNLTSVGTPNPKNLTYVRIDFTTTGNAIPNCHIDNILVRSGEVYEVSYNSTYMLMDANTRAWKQIATDNSDIIVAEEDSYRCFMLECTVAAQKELYGSGIAAQSDISDAAADLIEAYQEYKREHKSEALLAEESSHVFGNIYDGYSDDIMPGYSDYSTWDSLG